MTGPPNLKSQEKTMNDELKKIKNYYRRELKLDLPPGSCFMYRESNNMNIRYEPPCAFWLDGFDTEFTSDDVIVVGNEQKNLFTLVGAVTAFRSLSFFVLIRKATNLHAIEIRQPDILEGETPEEIVVLQGPDWKKLLDEYAEITAKKMNAPVIDAKKNLTGYCTWYYYYADVTEQNLLDNLEALKAKRDSGYRAQVVQIDDGYQTFQGDWNDQDVSWPTPLAEIGGRIVSAGMTAGIWLMPFLASTASRVFRDHPDWFVKAENGEPKVSFGWSPPPDHLWACLDMTVPAAREHIANVFKTFRAWGYTYFKMDGLGFGLMEGRRSDPDATPVSAFRLGMKAIREAVPESFLLGCCPPIMPCLGFIDGARVSGDTHASWGPILNCSRSTYSRWWMMDKFFRCDPDTIMARQDRSSCTIGESRVSALTGIATGVALTSDNLATIAPERFELLERAAKYRMAGFRPIEWHAGTWPTLFEGTVDGARAAAVVNDSEDVKEYTFEMLHLDPAKDAEELLHPMGKRRYVISVPAHDAVLLRQE